MSEEDGGLVIAFKSIIFGRGPLLAALMVACIAADARAQDSALRSLAKSAGLATDVAPPPDFIVKSRPAAPPPPMSVFQTPDEPPSKVKSTADLKAMDADLEVAGKKHDALRSAFPPSAKAMAEADAAQKAKARKKALANSSKSAF